MSIKNTEPKEKKSSLFKDYFGIKTILLISVVIFMMGDAVAWLATKTQFLSKEIALPTADFEVDFYDNEATKLNDTILTASNDNLLYLNQLNAVSPAESTTFLKQTVDSHIEGYMTSYIRTKNNGSINLDFYNQVHVIGNSNT